MKKIYFVTIIFVCNFFFCSFSQQPVYLDETKPVDERIEDALSRMTLEEKIAMCHAQPNSVLRGARVWEYLRFG